MGALANYRNIKPGFALGPKPAVPRYADLAEVRSFTVPAVIWRPGDSHVVTGIDTPFYSLSVHAMMGKNWCSVETVLDECFRLRARDAMDVAKVMVEIERRVDRVLEKIRPSTKLDAVDSAAYGLAARCIVLGCYYSPTLNTAVTGGWDRHVWSRVTNRAKIIKLARDMLAPFKAQLGIEEEK